MKKAIIFITILFLFVIAYNKFWFLRQPDRTIPFSEKHFVSPANGKISAVLEWGDSNIIWEKDKGIVSILTEDIGAKGWIIAITMDLTNVHYQRAPIKSTLISKAYKKGKFRNALMNNSELGFHPENEQNAMLFSGPNDVKFKVIQIAGLVTRRIEDYVEIGEEVNQGDVIGLIRLGS